MRLKITQIGNPKDVQTKYGVKQKNYIKVEEHGDKFLSYWVTSATASWKVGDNVEVENVTNREYEGKTYYDVVMPKTSGGVPAELSRSMEEVLGKLTKLNLMVSELLEAKRIRDLELEATAVYPPLEDYPDFETKLDNPPLI